MHLLFVNPVDRFSCDEAHMISLYISDAEIDKEITKERVKEFKSILLHYIDFQQKQKVIHWGKN